MVDLYRYAGGAAEACDAAALARNLVLAAELRALIARFEEQGIDLVVLKGIPLALRLFGSIAERSMVDNDLLVHRRDAICACRLLEGCGYRSIDCRRIETQLSLDYQFRMAKELPGGGVVAAELHWNAFSTLLYPVDEEVLWSHLERFTAQGIEARVFDRPLTLVHLAAHFAHSEFAVAQILRDIAAAWNRWYAGTAADEAVALARQVGLADVLDFGLLSAADLGLLASPPPPIRSRRAARLRRWLPAERLCEPRPTPDYARWMLGLLLVEPRRIPRWLRYALFPPLENLAAIESVPPSPAARWRYVIRPFRALGRALGGRRPRFVRT